MHPIETRRMYKYPRKYWQDYVPNRIQRHKQPNLKRSCLTLKRTSSIQLQSYTQKEYGITAYWELLDFNWLMPLDDNNQKATAAAAAEVMTTTPPRRCRWLDNHLRSQQYRFLNLYFNILGMVHPFGDDHGVEIGITINFSKKIQKEILYCIKLTITWNHLSIDVFNMEWR